MGRDPDILRGRPAAQPRLPPSPGSSKQHCLSRRYEAAQPQAGARPLALSSRALHAILSRDHCLSRVREQPFQPAGIEPYQRTRAATARGDEADRLTSNLKQRGRPMKTIVSALVALSVLAGIAAPANAALDAKTFFEKMDSARYALDTKTFFEQTDRARY
jgi:hypothetical protein